MRQLHTKISKIESTANSGSFAESPLHTLRYLSHAVQIGTSHKKDEFLCWNLGQRKVMQSLICDHEL